MNAANFVTCVRIALIPGFGVAWGTGHIRVALAIFVVASATDLLDGFIARTFDQHSVLGQILDPAADKLMLFTSFVVALVRRRVPVWLVALVIGRDVWITLGSVIFAMLGRERLKLERFPPTRLGKYNTFCEVIIIGLALLSERGGESVSAYIGATVIVTAVLTVLSASQYTVRAARALRGAT